MHKASALIVQSVDGDAEGETTPRMRKRRRAMGWAKPKKTKVANAIRVRFKVSLRAQRSLNGGLGLRCVAFRTTDLLLREDVRTATSGRRSDGLLPRQA